MLHRGDKSLHPMNPGLLFAAKQKVLKRSKDRIRKRAKKMEIVINKRGKNNEHWITFTIQNLDILQEKVLNVLQEWKGGKYVDPDRDCFKRVRDHWNRQKAAPLGSQFFLPIFKQLFQHIMINTNNIFPKDKGLLYFNIFKVTLDEKIKFDNTKALPLVLHALYDKPNDFRKFIDVIIKSWLDMDDSWRCSISPNTRSVRRNGDTVARSEYLRDPRRAQTKHHAFGRHLDEIISQISEMSQTGNASLMQRKFSEVADALDLRNDYLNANVDNDSNSVHTRDMRDISRQETHSVPPPQSVSPHANYGVSNGYNNGPIGHSMREYHPSNINHNADTHNLQFHGIFSPFPSVPTDNIVPDAYYGDHHSSINLPSQTPMRANYIIRNDPMHDYHSYGSVHPSQPNRNNNMNQFDRSNTNHNVDSHNPQFHHNIPAIIPTGYHGYHGYHHSSRSIERNHPYQQQRVPYHQSTDHMHSNGIPLPLQMSTSFDSEVRYHVACPCCFQSQQQPVDQMTSYDSRHRNESMNEAYQDNDTSHSQYPNSGYNYCALTSSARWESDYL